MGFNSGLKELNQTRMVS